MSERSEEIAATLAIVVTVLDLLRNARNRGGGVCSVGLPELARDVGTMPSDLLRSLADGVEAGAFTISAIQIEEVHER